MNSSVLWISLVAAYFLGSIPFGYLLVRIFRGADVRATGSGNIGATNVARTSPLLGAITLLLDAGKGLGAVALAMALLPGNRAVGFAAAFAAICGHVFSVWLRFRGGKGVATGLGSMVLLTPKAILVAVGIFLIVAATFRWIALASITGTALLPAAAWVTREIPPSSAATHFSSTPLWFVCGSSIVIIVKHHSNIRRMLAGTEPRFGRKTA